MKEPLVERLYSEASTHRGPMAAMSPVDAAPDDDAAAGAEPAPPPLDASKLPPTFHCVPARRLTTVSDVALGGCTPAQLWRVAFGDGAGARLRHRYHAEQMGHWNVCVGRWAPHATLGRARLVTFEAQIHGVPIGPPTTRVLEYESHEPLDDAARAAGAAATPAAADAGFRVRTVTQSLDATFGDRFNMETVVEVSPDTRAGARGVRLARRCGVHFVRRLPSLLESFVTYSVVETSRAGACAWMELVDEAIALETAQRDARSALAARPALAAALDARDDRADSADSADGADGDDGGETPCAAADPFCGARSTRWSCGGAAGRAARERRVQKGAAARRKYALPAQSHSTAWRGLLSISPRAMSRRPTNTGGGPTYEGGGARQDSR